MDARAAAAPESGARSATAPTSEPTPADGDPEREPTSEPARAATPEPAWASVWVDADGVPERMLWRGERYRVSDRPTVWMRTSAWWAPFGGSDLGYGRPPLSIGGWRFRATTETGGVTSVFDVVSGGAQWSVLRVHG
jgi:hypothetical protein